MSKLPKPGTTRRSAIPPPSSVNKPTTRAAAASRRETISGLQAPQASKSQAAHQERQPAHPEQKQAAQQEQKQTVQAQEVQPPQKPQPTTVPPPTQTPKDSPSKKASITPLQSQKSESINEIAETSSSPQNDAKVQALQAEVDDLKAKLEALRGKREEDKNKLKELDRLRISYQNLVEFKTAVLDEQRMLREKLEESEAKLAQSELRATKMEREMSNNLSDQLEMVTLDKLVAEERAENLQIELEDQKHKVLALESEVALLKNSRVTQNVDSDGAVVELTEGNDNFSDVSVQIENYKNALIKMRDIVATANFERTDMQQQYEQCREEYQRLEAENEKLTTELMQVYDEVSGLHEQLDDAMGSSRMVEYLTEKNLDLEDKVRALTDEKDHLEELVQLTEEIAESARESQLEMRKECDEYIVQLNEKYNEIGQLEIQIAQYDNIVQKFRQKTVDLNNEIVDHKDKIKILEHQLDQRDASGSTAITALFSSTRSFADSINSELNSLELKFLNEYNKYLRIFLPDNFSKAGCDLDSILLIIFFPRVAAKAELLARLLTERFVVVPDGMQREHVVKSNKAEQWANVRKFHYYLRVLIGVARRFETMTLNCTIESLTRLAMQRTEITNQERHINQYFDLLKSGHFDENTSTDQLNRVSALLQKIFSVNVSATEYDTRKAFADYLLQFADGLRWIRFNCERIKFFVFPAELEDSSDFIDFVRGIGSAAEKAESQLLRAQKLLPTDKMLDLSHDVLDSVLNAFMLTEKIASILHDTSALAVSQLTTNAGREKDGTVIDVDGFTTNELKEFFQSVVEKREGHRTVNEAIKEVRSAMLALNSSIDEISNKLERRQFELPMMVERTNPLVERSQTQKRDEADAENLRWEITKKEESIAQLAKALKGLEDNISFLKIQVEREKQKNAKMGKSDAGGQVPMNAEQIQEALSKEQEKHKEEMESLRAKLSELEKQLTEKESQVKRIVSKSAAAALFDPSSYSLDRSNLLSEAGKGSDRVPPQISGFQQSPTEMLQSLHWAHERVRRLQAELDSRQMMEMRPLNVSSLNVYGPETLRLHNQPTKTVSTDHIEVEHRHLLDEANLLLLESKKLAAIPAHKRKTDAYRRQLSEYNKRAIDLRLRTRAFGTRNYPNLPLPSAAPNKE